jgi:long-chain acyl-CoA synthetase
MAARDPVDDFRPSWASFAEFFESRVDVDEVFLAELNCDAGTRRAWTVGQWKARVRDTASWLADNGVLRGHAVAVLGGNDADTLAFTYACWFAGVCCVPLNPGDALDRHAFIADSAAVCLLFSTDHGIDRARDIAAATGATLVTPGDLPAREPAAAPTSTDPREVAAPAPTSLEDAALRVYTSGTTGEPKGAVLTAANLLIDCDALAQRTGWDEQTRILTVLPIHHVNGLVVSSLLPWFVGASTVLCDRFRSETFWNDAQREGATVASLVPTLLEFLLESPGEPPDHFTEVLCGAGPLLVETVLSFEQRFRVPVRHLYGLSETTAVITAMPRLSESERREWHGKFGFPSIGPALPHARVAVLDQLGRALPSESRGELAVRGAMLMTEYAARPVATQEAFRGDWFHTGDEGFWTHGPHDEPYFFITGRLKELIIRGGVNISPFEVDSVLCSHPAVRYGLAIPFENRYYGDEIAAYVVLKSTATEAEIITHCAQQLDFARTPKVVLFGEDLPFTTTGKAKRLELKARLAPALREYRNVQFRRNTTITGDEAT